MANIFDYLDWRGDISFEESPFNEVDNLILSALAYVDFDDIVPRTGRPMPLQAVCGQYFSMHTRDELEARTTFSKSMPFLLEKVGQTGRFRDMTLSNYVNEVDEERGGQFSAVTFRPGDGTVYVAFRGTDDSLLGWKEAFDLSFEEETGGQRLALAYVETLFGHGHEKLRLGGHSKGGNFAVYAGAFCRPKIRRRILEVWSNDGPGLMELNDVKPGYKEIFPRIHSIIPAGAIVGVLMSDDYQHEVIVSDGDGIMQHAAETWQVLGDRFVRAEKRTFGSEWFEETFCQVLRDMDDSDREAFVDGVYTMVTAGGYRTLDDLNRNPAKTAADMAKALRNLSDEKRGQVLDTLGLIIKSGAGILTDSAAESGRRVVKDIAEGGRRLAAGVSGMAGAAGEKQADGEEADAAPAAEKAEAAGEAAAGAVGTCNQRDDISRSEQKSVDAAAEKAARAWLDEPAVQPKIESREPSGRSRSLLRSAVVTGGAAALVAGRRIRRRLRQPAGQKKQEKPPFGDRVGTGYKHVSNLKAWNKEHENHQAGADRAEKKDDPAGDAGPEDTRGRGDLPPRA